MIPPAEAQNSAAGNWVTRPYDAADHVLLGSSPDLDAADAALAPLITADLLRDVVAAVPDEWLDAEREAYVAPLLARRDARDAWLPGVRDAVARRVDHAPTRTANPPSWLTDRRPR